ncbi:hypothetical protein NDU88_002557 [Pleurodeles waltl]|uniref:Uncharacterized protein n=1 Tax=Pleurodeles waltl TaxID=8319 RepID=A0AAV7NI16_PLEWA|nr:hypothetical protein NDU88_002557 [Pleurodeles waltl]
MRPRYTTPTCGASSIGSGERAEVAPQPGRNAAPSVFSPVLEGVLEAIWRPGLLAPSSRRASKVTETPPPRRSAQTFGIPCTLRPGRA